MCFKASCAVLSVVVIFVTDLTVLCPSRILPENCVELRYSPLQPDPKSPCTHMVYTLAIQYLCYTWALRPKYIRYEHMAP